MAQPLFLYESISAQLRSHIYCGSYQAGERLPSVRQLSHTFGVSINTIIQCFRQLELDGFIEIRPRSGVYVSEAPPRDVRPDSPHDFDLLPVEVSLSDDILHYMEPHRDARLARLGIALPSESIMPVERTLRTLRDITRKHPGEIWDYMHPHGHALLTHQLARRSLVYEHPVKDSDIIVTNGCMEAVELALRTVTRRGDTVAVDTPTYYGTLLALEVLQRKVLELPTHWRDGPCLYSLEKAMKRGQVQACLLSPNSQNPLGFTMSAERKRKLVQLATLYQVPIIENDIWGDTVYSGDGLPAKAWDQHGMVIYCNSFSKTLMPGLRLGWVAPGRFYQRLRELKQISSITTASAPQLLLGRLMESGFYAQHLVQLRERLQFQTRQTAELILGAFPAGTSVSRPTGGCVLWVGLPDGIDSREVFVQALANDVHVFPGIVFSSDQRHASHLRINAGSPVGPHIETAISTLGHIAGRLGKPA